MGYLYLSAIGAALAAALYTLLRYRSSCVLIEQLKQLENKTVLISGAGSGLGKSLAHHFYQRRCRLILFGHRLSDLMEVSQWLVSSLGAEMTAPPPEPICYEVDLADPKAVEKFAAEVIDRHRSVHILVNNAGLSVRARALNTTMEVHRHLMEVNYFGHIAITQKLLQSNVGLQSVVFVGSVQGLISIPFRSAYAASKHAVQAYADSLRAEICRDGIDVLVVSPAYIRTNLSLNAMTGTGGRHGQMDPTTEQGMKPDDVAELIIQSVVRGDQELLLAPLSIRAGLLLRRLWPGAYFRLMAERALSE